ncbi:hypothetical protein EV421DRAFT_1800038 [Armillaria borealis]|uniref:Secreted protein n=1 Tax=Armillaria borealis TaxID=47425 RepID=A0AA39JM95_9AGAR|nr:hypothetical protein EV421DRAFT_1800038 [Armillaria borealis]
MSNRVTPYLVRLLLASCAETFSCVFVDLGTIPIATERTWVAQVALVLMDGSQNIGTAPGRDGPLLPSSLAIRSVLWRR